jgi:hypothetical protein
MKNVSGFGLPWFEPDDYLKCERYFKTPLTCPVNTRVGLPFLTQSFKEVTEAGFTPLKVKINADKFTAWCMPNKRDVTGENLYPFVSDKAWHIANSSG